MHTYIHILREPSQLLSAYETICTDTYIHILREPTQLLTAYWCVGGYPRVEHLSFQNLLAQGDILLYVQYVCIFACIRTCVSCRACSFPTLSFYIHRNTHTHTHTHTHTLRQIHTLMRALFSLAAFLFAVRLVFLSLSFYILKHTHTQIHTDTHTHTPTHTLP
jgi:hypothetical protein